MMARQRADANFSAFGSLGVREFAETIDVDQHRGPRQPKIYRRDQAMATGEKTGFVAIFRLQDKRVIERRSCNIFEWSRLHRYRSETAPHRPSARND